MQRARQESVKDFEGSVGQEAFGYLHRGVADCVDAGLFRPLRMEITAQVLWVSVHGLVSLLIAKKGFPFATKAVLIDELVETLVGGLLK